MPGMEEEVQEQDIYAFIKDHKKEIIISFIAAAALIFVITALAGLEDIINVLENTNYWLLALNFALEALILILWTLRWKMILDVVDESPRFRSLLLMLTASLFGNNITPGAAGGEPLRAYILREIKGTPFEIGFASSTADRVFEFLPFVLISILAAFLILSWSIALWIRVAVTIIIFLIVVFFSVVVYAGANQDIAQRLTLSIAKKVFPLALKLTRREMHFSEIREQIIFYVHRFTTGFGMALKDRQVLVIGIIISFAMWGLDIVRMYVCFLAVGVEVAIVPIVVIYTVGILIQLLPLIPGSLGIREVILVGLFAAAGISADIVMAASILDRLASYIAPTLIGAFAAFYYGKIMVSEKNLEPS